MSLLNRKSPEQRRIPVWVQVLAVSSATGISLAYATIATPWFTGYDPTNMPEARAFWVTVFATAVYAVLLFVASIPAVSVPLVLTVLPERGEELFDRGKNLRLMRWVILRRHGVGLVTLFLLALACAVVLGWFTLGSGGAAESPFKDSLLAIALLSPFIANHWATPLAILVADLVVYALFSQTLIEIPVVYTPPPQSVDIATTVVTTITAVGIAVLVKWGTTRRNADSDRLGS